MGKTDVSKASKAAKKVFKAPEAIKGHKFIWTPEDMERYKKTGKVPKLSKAERRLAEKAVKKGAKKGIARRVISKLGWPGKVAVGAMTVHDIIKSLPEGTGKACKSGQYRNKKGICVNVEGVVKKDPKH